jgi:hypothetical protein
MTTQFVEFGDRLLQSQISQKSDVLNDLRGTMHQFLELARSVDSSEDLPEKPTLGLSAAEDSTATLDTQREDSVTLVTQREDSAKLPQDVLSITPLTGFPASFAIGSPTRARNIISPVRLALQGQFSPRLGYGMLGGVVSRPALIMTLHRQYKIGGILSFATRLHYEAVQTAFKALTGIISIPEYIPWALRFVLRHGSIDSIARMARDFLDIISYDYDDTKVGFEEDDQEHAKILLSDVFYASLGQIIRTVAREFVAEGMTIDDWLDPWDTYEYIRSRWNLRLTATAILISKGSRNARTANTNINIEISMFGENTTTDIVVGSTSLISRLISRMICLGEGPRFRKVDIDESIDSLLKNL